MRRLALLPTLAAVALLTAGAAGAAVARCPARALRATYTFDFASNGAGHVGYTLTITNRSAAACGVSEPLKLTLLGARGQALPTDAVFPASPGPPVRLAPGRWAQAKSLLSPDLAAPGEPTSGLCESPAHALRITIGGAALVAAMDETPVCQRGRIAFGALAAVPATPACSIASLAGALRRLGAPFGGFAEYRLTLRNRSTLACHVNSVVSLRLLDARGRRLRTQVFSPLSAPLLIAPGATKTALLGLSVSGGGCRAPAHYAQVAPSGGAFLRIAVVPPVAPCHDGRMSLSSLFQNGAG